jgi:diguanylate cyclase (GGDEF)-like protein
VALLIIDLDKFKALNDTLGHLAGDQALLEVARRLRRLAGNVALIARMGGDEFIVLMTGASAMSEAQALAAAIVDAVRQPILIDGEITAELGASIGLAVAPHDAATPTELARRADVALYRAKAAGRSRSARFVAAMDEELSWRRTIEHALRQAISARQLSLAYQPQFDADGLSIVGAEALLRWTHPTLGTIPPSVFIPVAEEQGLMWELGAFVLETALRETREWDNLPIAVNVSAQQFKRGDLPALVEALLFEADFPAHRLELEITESAVVQDESEAAAQIGRLKAIGVSIALDDFGTGYSSLSYLRQFAFDKLKIDRSFVQDLAQANDSNTIVHAIIAMSQGLGLRVVAEGVEDADQHTLLRLAGCDQLQGYLFSKPLPAAGFVALARASRQHPILSIG